MSDVNNIPQIQNLNEEERKVFFSLLSATRNSDSFAPIESIYKVDYEEIPVTIDEFLENDYYLGKVYNNGKNIYPYWRHVLHDFFHNNSDKRFELVLTGCLSGDTLIPLLNGEEHTIRELYLDNKKKYEVYSFDVETNRYTVGNTTDVIFTGIKPVYKITLDNGESISVTSDHKFLTRDKHWKSIDTGLSIGDSLMPFNRSHDERGYELINHPQKDGTFIQEPTHRMSMYSKRGGFKGVVHHKNFKKHDNSPSNLLLSDWYSHRKYHTRKGGKQLESFNKQARIEGTPEREIVLANALKGNHIRWSDPAQRERARQKMISFNSDPEFQKKALAGRTEESSRKNRERLKEFNKNHPNIRKLLDTLPKDLLIEELKNSYNYTNLMDKYKISRTGLESLFYRYEIDPRDYVKDCPVPFPHRYYGPLFSIYNTMYKEHGYVSDELMRGNKKKPSSTIKDFFNGDEEAFLEVVKNYNHKIVSIEYVGETDVYDLTVDKYHNFAVSSGCVVHNCIGSGKTTISAIALMYLIYKTLCLKEPQKFYGLSSNSPIAFVVMNLTLELAYGGLYSLIVEAMKLSPWFSERVDIRGKYEFSISFPKNIVFMAGSQTQHTIGRNVLGAVLDEINFSNAPKGSKNSVMDMYRNLRRRLESRFLKQGRIPGLLCLVSSKNTELDFLEQYIQSIKHQKTTWVVDEPIWNIKPSETYVGEKFKVAVGDKTKESFIIGPTDNEDDLIQKGYYIIEPPIEYKTAFEQDINDALKDIAGISAVSTSKLIPYAGRIDVCFNGNKPNPFFSEQIELGLDSIEDIRDFLDDIRCIKTDLEKPRFAHVDIGLKNDRLGLAIVHVDKSINVERYTETGAIEQISEPHYKVDLMLTIKAAPGSETPLYKIREFFIWLSSVIGYKFKMITYDGFQSADSIQLLKTAGLPADLLSVDRTDVPYLILRSAILEQRLESYYNSIVVEELRDLEYDRKGKKVDHPITKVDGTPGSKDTSDALCGAVYNAQLYYSKQKGVKSVQRTNVSAAISALQKIKNVQKAKEELDNWILD